MRKYKHHILYIVIATILLGLITINNGSNVSALSYQSSVGVGFTFLPTLNVSLSSDNLIINNLVPGGNAVDSNTITINVSTNIAEGYNLFTTVGNSNNETINLTNVSNNNYTFTPLSSNVSELSNFANNNWGYSYSNDSGTTWISGDCNNASTGYNGLPLYTNSGIKLVEEADNTSSTVDFKIAAKAGNTQPSGEYTNVINFTVVSNTIPTTMLDAFIASGAQMYNGYFKMQDMTPTICSSIDTDGEKGMQLIDVRDDKVYWVAKLKDNNCWMTQNLDLDLSSSVALTSETSDIDPESYGKTIYTAETGYSKDATTGIVSWTPSTIDGEGVQHADTIDMVWSSNTTATAPGWTDDYNKPYSADAGDRYRYTNPSTYNETNYTSLEACSNNNDSDTAGCQHAHFGNYYNWPAAAVTNNASVATNWSTWGNSVCPKNWDLPAYDKYGAMLTAQGVYDSGYATNGFKKIRTAPLYFALFGRVSSGLLVDLSSWGRYRSSTLHDANSDFGFIFASTAIYPNYYNYGYRGYGFSVRCMVNTN